MQVITKNTSYINNDKEIFSPLPLKKQSQSVKKPNTLNNSNQLSLNNTSSTILQLSPQRSCFNYNSPLKKSLLNSSFQSNNNNIPFSCSASSTNEDCLSDSDDQSNHSSELISSISKLRHVTSNPIQKNSQFKVTSPIQQQQIQEQELCDLEEDDIEDMFNDLQRELSLNESQEYEI